MPVHNVKANDWVRDIVPLILNLTTRWRWVVTFMPWPYRWGKSSWYLWWTQHVEKRKVSFSFFESNPGSSSHSLDTMQAELFSRQKKFFIVQKCYWMNTYLLTYSMEHSPTWEANRFSSSQEIPQLLRNSKVHCCIHKCIAWKLAD